MPQSLASSMINPASENSCFTFPHILRYWLFLWMKKQPFLQIQEHKNWLSSNLTALSLQKSCCFKCPRNAFTLNDVTNWMKEIKRDMINCFLKVTEYQTWSQNTMRRRVVIQKHGYILQLLPATNIREVTSCSQCRWSLSLSLLLNPPVNWQKIQGWLFPSTSWCNMIVMSTVVLLLTLWRGRVRF